MFSWLFNKIKGEELRRLELEFEKLKVRFDAVDDLSKKTRAYVGYHEKKGKKVNDDAETPDLDDLSPAEQEFLRSTIEYKEMERIKKMQNIKEDADF